MTTKGKTWGDSIKVGEIDCEVFSAALVSAEILLEDQTQGAFPNEGATRKLALELRDYYLKTASEENCGECDQCEGVSPLSLTLCPYCGSADVGEATETADNQEAAPMTNKDEKKHAGAIVPTKPVAGTVTAAPSVQVQVGRKHDALKETNTGTEGLAGSEKKLDASVATIQKLKVSYFQSCWQLGNKVRTEIYDNQLWKFRTTEDGKIAYRTFDQFCKAELGIGVVQAYKWMDVSADFTEADVAQFGVSKLGHLLGLPPAAKEKLLGDVRAGATAATIAEAAKKERGGKARETPRSGKTSAKQKASAEKATKARVEKASAAKADTKKAPPETGGRITIGQIEGKKTIKLYSKPATGKKNVDLGELKRARKIGDQPFGFFDLHNGVRQWIEIRTNAAGELEAIIETRRHEE